MKDSKISSAVSLAMAKAAIKVGSQHSDKKLVEEAKRVK
jgi:hypothetical protein